MAQPGATTPVLNWGTDALWRLLDPVLPGVTVEVMGEVASTNTTLLERARAWVAPREPVAGAAAPASGGTGDAGERRADETRAPGTGGRRAADAAPWLLVGEHQTRGRGRLGHRWESAPGASLTFSLSMPLRPLDWSGLSLAVGVALADTLDPGASAAPRIGLKWPNDLWLMAGPLQGPGRKLGGILIETTPVGDRRMVVVGIGLNITAQAFEGLSHGYACLQELEPQATPPSVLHRVAVPVVEALRAFEAHGFQAFESRYARRDLLRGRPLQTTLREAPAGVSRGVDGRGALRLVLPEGGEKLVTAGEVSVRFDDPSLGGSVS